MSGQNKEVWDWILSKPENTVCSLKYYDGCGNTIDELIFQVDPMEISLSDPDYASSEECTITISFKTESVERMTKLPVN